MYCLSYIHKYCQFLPPLQTGISQGALQGGSEGGGGSTVEAQGGQGGHKVVG